MNPDLVIERIGIVDAVLAKRKGSDVKYLEANIRFHTDLDSDYNYGEDKRIDNISVAFPVSTGINPGDVVELTLRVTSPLGARFAPALTAGVDDSE